jgi:hypothetical protein
VEAAAVDDEQRMLNIAAVAQLPFRSAATNL